MKISTSRFTSILALLLLVSLFSGLASARKWTSQDGKFSIDAELIEATDTEVKLLRKNGKEITVPLDRLSEADQEFAKSQIGKPAKSAPPSKKPAATKPAAGGAKLTPISFKIFDDEFTMDAPAGAKVTEEGAFPMIRAGKKFTMSVQPNSESELADFKQQFGGMSEFTQVQKVLAEEENVLAYKVLMKAFKQEISVYMVVVELDGKKYTCTDSSMEEINMKDKLSPKDIELLIQCAKSLKKKGA